MLVRECCLEFSARARLARMMIHHVSRPFPDWMSISCHETPGSSIRKEKSGRSNVSERLEPDSDQDVADVGEVLVSIKRAGEITKEVSDLLGLGLSCPEPILLGDSNIQHMKKRHPNDYEKYGRFIPSILSAPDYVGMNRNDSSIEYVKEFQIDNEWVKVAVRVSASGVYFARSLYVLNPTRVKNFIQKGTLKNLR